MGTFVHIKFGNVRLMRRVQHSRFLPIFTKFPFFVLESF